MQRDRPRKLQIESKSKDLSQPGPEPADTPPPSPPIPCGESAGALAHTPSQKIATSEPSLNNLSLQQKKIIMNRLMNLGEEERASVLELIALHGGKTRLEALSRAEPLEWVRAAFDWGQGELISYDGPDLWQEDVLREIGVGVLTVDQALRLAVASGHGIGKSALVAWIILWALSTMPDTKGVVTANTEVQLKTKTWAELAKWHRLAFNRAQFTFGATAIYSSDTAHEKTWRIDMIPWSLVNTEAFAGLHNQGKRILLVYDEASAIPDAIWEVSEGALTDKATQIMWLCFGNPTRNTGRFRECFGKFRNRWSTKQIDSRTSKFANLKQIAEWSNDWGDESDFFKVRVRGEFPGASVEQFISSDDVARAQKAIVEVDKTLPKVISVDVARFGDDQTVIGLRQGRVFRILKRLTGADNVEVAEHVALAIEEHDPQAVIVDADGLGAGVVDQLRHRGYRPFEFHGGAKPTDSKSWFNKRAEVWGRMRAWLGGTVQIDNDRGLASDLTSPTYNFPGVKGQLQLEKKSDMKKRGLSSPDAGDCLAMSFSLDLRAPEPISAEEMFVSSNRAASWMR